MIKRTINPKRIGIEVSSEGKLPGPYTCFSLSIRINTSPTMFEFIVHTFSPFTMNKIW